MTTQTAIIIGLVIYCVAMLGVSAFFMLRVSKPADYLVAGRGRPAFVLTGTIAGMCIGTGVLIGATGLAYQHGWAGCAQPLGLGFGTLLIGLMFAVMRRYKFMTLAEEIACYYGNNRIVVEFSNISLFLSQLGWLTVQIMGGTVVLGVVTGMPRDTCMVLAGLIMAAFSIPGGLKAVVYINFLQTAVLLTGFLLLAYTALANSGGLGGLTQGIPPERLSFLGADSYGGWKVFGLLLVLTLAVIADPGRRLAMFTAQSTKGAVIATVSAGLIVMCFSVLIGVTGMYAFKLNAGLDIADKALPWLVTEQLSPWLAALVVVAIASGVVSTANANATAAGTFYVRHIFPLATGRFPKNPTLTARYALAGAFVIATLTGLFTTDIIDFIRKFLSVTMSGLAVMILAGRFWKRATWQGALAALVVTPVVSLATMIAANVFSLQGVLWANPVIPASVAGMVALIVTSLLTPRNPFTFEQVAEQMRQTRDSLENVPPRT